MVRLRSEYQLSYKWLPTDLCLDVRLGTADFRSHRRIVDFAQNDWWPRNGCSRLNGCECDCDLENDACDEADRHLPASRIRRRHDQLVDQWRRLHEKQLQRQPLLTRTTEGEDRKIDAKENRKSPLQITQSDRSCSAPKNHDSGDDNQVARRTDRHTEKSQPCIEDDDSRPPARRLKTTTKESIVRGSNRQGTTQMAVDRDESIYPRLGLSASSTDARRKKMTDIGPAAVDEALRETTVSKRPLRSRSGHPPAPSISFRRPDQDKGHGHWIASEKVRRPPTVNGCVKFKRDEKDHGDGKKHIQSHSKAEKLVSSLNAGRRSRSFSRLKSTPTLVNDSSIWMSEYQRNYTKDHTHILNCPVYSY